MARWRVDPAMAIWGVAFGVFATLTGLFVLSAIEGGFLAEGFFLLVISWVVFFVAVAKVVAWTRRRRGKG
ncbi:MAG: hypothetical protein A3K67_07245 [Euryarchaeota archaeon RBG_16_62_10]|nr:MAG: hypothetical protein A3K67_07245 [Euryarchaeota archaeon RBG_16_62_10]